MVASIGRRSWKTRREVMKTTTVASSWQCSTRKKAVVGRRVHGNADRVGKNHAEGERPALRRREHD